MFRERDSQLEEGALSILSPSPSRREVGKTPTTSPHRRRSGRGGLSTQAHLGRTNHARATDKDKGMTECNSEKSNSAEHLEYTECFCSFLDIVGFKEFVKESKEDPKRLAELVKVLNELADLKPYQSERRNPSTGKTRRWELQIRAFSDNICLFIHNTHFMILYRQQCFI